MMRAPTAFALGVFSLAAGLASPARADLAVGAEVYAPFAMSTEERADGPGLLGEVSVRWSPAESDLTLGFTMAARSETYSSSFLIGQDASLRDLNAGVLALYHFGPRRWDVRPYIGVGAGYTHLSMERFLVFPYKGSAHGFYGAPQIGLRARVAESIELIISGRYHHAFAASKQLQVVDELRTRHFSALGMGLGAYFRF